MTRVLRRGSAVPGGRAVPGDRAPAGGVRGGAAADGRGGQGRRGAQGRHVRDGRPGGARPHRRAGRIRPGFSGDAALLQRHPLRRLRHLARAPRGVLARARRRAARRIGAVTNSGGEGEYFADKAEQAGIPLQPLSAELLRAGSAASSRTSPHVGNPADCWAIDDDRDRLPARLRADGRVGGVRRAACRTIDHRHWLIADERQLAQNIADDLRAACEGTDMFPCVITVTTADPPIEDLRWAREHDIPMLKGIAARPARAGGAARATAAGCRPRAMCPRRRRWSRRRRAARARLGRDRRAPTACPTSARERCATADEAPWPPPSGSATRWSSRSTTWPTRRASAASRSTCRRARRCAAAAERMGGSVIVAEQVARRRRGAGRHGPRSGLRADRGGRHRRRARRGARPGHRQPGPARP